MYQQIAAEVKRVEGFTVKTCWIAHVKEQLGLPMRTAPNRHGAVRVHPCPANKRPAIIAAMKRLKVI